MMANSSPLLQPVGSINQSNQSRLGDSSTALWNHDHDTLIAMTAMGVDRAELIALADQLELEDVPNGAYISDLAFAF
jgi:hypothetical protein